MVCITRRCVDHDQDHTPGDAKRGLWDNAGYEKPNAGYETTHTHIIVAKYTSTSHQIKLPCLNSNDHTGQLHRPCVTSIAIAALVVGLVLFVMAAAMGTAILMKVGSREGSGEWKNDGDGGFYDDYGGLYAKQTGKCRIFF